MSSVDNRIVSMKFDNASFEKGVGTTLGTLDKLKESLKLTGANKGMTDLQDTASKFSLGPVDGAVTGISKSFLAMSTVAITALANITTKAISAGTEIVKSLTIDPIKAGFTEYETNLNSIQTVLANTASAGTTLDQVNGALSKLNTYSDQTIYNFSEMARNIGTFTAAGVDLDTSVKSIKGIANLAAISGSNSQQASTAMYQLSQAIASGKVNLMDWNSVVNAGMGGKTFQDALYRTGKAMGSIITVGSGKNKVAYSIDEWVKSGNNFRDSLQSGWLTSEVLTQTLEGFTGDLSDAQLKSMGYTQDQIKEIQALGKTGTDAATKVKTLTQLLDTLREGVGSGWAQTWQIVFGDFGEAKESFTAVSDRIGGMVKASSDARNKMLGDWKTLGGRTALIDSIRNAFDAVVAVLKPIKDAFRDIFPAMTGQRLFDLTVKLRDFTENLKIGDATADNLKRTFRGVFAIFSIAKQIIGGVIGVITHLIGSLAGGSGGFLEFTGGIGDFLVSVDSALKKGGFLSAFFDSLGKILAVPIQLFTALGSLLGDLFGSFDSGSAEDTASSIGDVAEKLSPLQALGERIGSIFSGLSGVFEKLGDILAPFIDKIASAMTAVGNAISDAFSGGNFDSILDTINTALFGGFVLLIRKFLKNGSILEFGGGGMFDSITGAFESLSGTLQTMQTNIKADTLLKIAGAVALLTVSIVALSLIDSDKLTKALTAIAVAFTQLLAAMAILDKIGSGAGFAKIPIISAAMILLSTAILVLSAAVKVLSTLSWTELLKGLSGVAALLGILALSVQPLSANSSGMVRAGAGIIAIGLGIKILASAIGDFAEFSMLEIGKGLVSVAASLAIMIVAMKQIPPNMAITAASIMVLAAAMKVMASAVSDFGSMSLGTIVKGLAGISSALILVSSAMKRMPKNMIAQAAALVLVGVALKSVSKAVSSMGEMSWEEIGKGLISLSGALIILSVALRMMSGTLPGSAALVIAAAGLAILVPVLTTLGSLSWGTIIKGLVTIAASLTVLGIAGALLTPVLPVLAGLGLALLALGGGLALAGAGALAFATAIGILASIGGAAAVVITNTLQAIIATIPAALKAFAEGIISFAEAIATGGPAFVAAMTTVLGSLIDAIINTIPKIAELANKIISTILSVLVTNIPKIAAAGLRIIVGFMTAIRNNIGKVVALAGDIIVAYIRGVSNNLSKIISAGADLLVKFVKGIGDNSSKVVAAGTNAAIKFINAVGDNANKLASAGADAIIDFVRGLREEVDTKMPKLREEGRLLAGAIINGMTGGLGAKIGEVARKAADVARAALNAAKRALGIDSPSKEFHSLGVYSGEGMANGLGESTRLVDAAAEDLTKGSLIAVKKSMAQLSNIISEEIKTEPTITPVLDLTDVYKGASRLKKTFSGNLIVASVSTTAADSISTLSSNRSAVNQPQTPAYVGPPVVKEIKFEQNISSPKPLSPFDIYRGTRSQLAMAKEALVA